MIPVWAEEGALLLGVRRAGFWLGLLGVVAASRSVAGEVSHASARDTEPGSGLGESLLGVVAGGAGEVSRIRGEGRSALAQSSCGVAERRRRGIERDTELGSGWGRSE
ncbi:Os01g0877100 [Oryza sativa Japonica Group]|uniref:Os01g0877100 protein n=1 Tax=Oryza sativa subsp. japonica TaxID=39947 RepID=A0A0N7KE60_ORYSJ|nr:Os01g0877100 [Oryza sativa Japonica Group]